MRFAVRSDKGIVREVNEDSYRIISGLPGVSNAFIIADGMGGHNSGEVASSAAVEAAADYIKRYGEGLSREESIPGAIKDAMQEANTVVYNMSLQEAANSGMGTTFIAAVIFKDKIYIGHVGDSRAYLIREDKIIQITTDHSYVEELVQNGSLTREEAENHPQKNIITRALGCSEEMQIDTYSSDIFENDYIVLCTDGLTNMIAEDEIMKIVVKTDDLEHACEELIEEANRKGGNDNITVIAIKNEKIR